MKNLLILTLLLSFKSKSQVSNCNQKIYSIEIFDENYSMAYTTRYRIFNDSLVIKNESGVEGDKDSCLVVKKIADTQREKILRFLNSFDFIKLKNKYENPNINDGDRKTVRICFKSKLKTININNVYQKDMANLFDLLNQIIDPEFRIRYKSDTKPSR